MKYLILALALTGLTACNNKLFTSEGEDRVVYVPAPPESVQQIVADENAYRLGLGQTQLSSGLSCTLSTFTAGDRIQASIAGHNTLSDLTQVATFLLTQPFNQQDANVSEGMNVLPVPLRSVYQNMYKLVCSGFLVVTETEYVQFDLRSDDGSVLYVDGAKLLDNDNGHGPTDVSGTKYMRRGVHAMRLDYAQSGGGSQALVLKANGDVIDPGFFVH